MNGKRKNKLEKPSYSNHRLLSNNELYNVLLERHPVTSNI